MLPPVGGREGDKAVQLLAGELLIARTSGRGKNVARLRLSVLKAPGRPKSEPTSAQLWRLATGASTRRRMPPHYRPSTRLEKHSTLLPAGHGYTNMRRRAMLYILRAQPHCAPRARPLRAFNHCGHRAAALPYTHSRGLRYCLSSAPTGFTTDSAAKKTPQRRSTFNAC